jgi:hypothetical protein
LKVSYDFQGGRYTAWKFILFNIVDMVTCR